MFKTRPYAVGAAGVLALGAAAMTAVHVQAADHLDSPAVSAEPLADITDLYAWTTADRLRLVLAVSPNAGEAVQFSPNVQYAFHVQRGAAFPAGPFETTEILCQFYTPTQYECWAGSEYVAGTADVTAGAVNTSGNLRVFAGRRDDPFFFNFTGFTKVLEDVRAVVASGSVPADGNGDGCPDIPASITGPLVAQLSRSNPDGAPVNHFEGHSVMAIVVDIARSSIAGSGDFLKVSASTHRGS